MKLGQEGKGIFWDLIEMMYEQSGYLLLSQIEIYAFALKTEPDKIRQIINDFDLFENDTIGFWNESVRKRLALREEKSIKALQSLSNRWKGNERIQDKIRTYYERNTIKESKVKEIKENKGNKNIKTDPLWKTSFDEYKKSELEAYTELIKNTEWIQKQEKIKPFQNLNILKTIERAHLNFWSTEVGWKNKKKSGSKELNWQATYANAIGMKPNQVFNDRNEKEQPISREESYRRYKEQKALEEQEKRCEIRRSQMTVRDGTGMQSMGDLLQGATDGIIS
jgi:hypothetical protein